MKNELNLHRLDVKAFAKKQMHIEGEIPLAQLPRLHEDCVGDVTTQVSWAAQGALEAGQGGQDAVWLHLEASAQVPLTCQRCLNPVLTDLAIAQDFRFVPDEATALAEDDESQEDLLVLSQEFDLLELIEDELLMALPLVPMHEACLSEHAPTSEGDLTADLGQKPNPFAVLATLKTRKS
jgi:uncharacterized protein